MTRRLDGTGLEDELHDQAVTGGLQLSHRFRDDTWNLGVRTCGSWVHGSADAITATQTDFRHLYQRPDADHLAVDPTRTSLSGAGVVWDLGKVGGKHWRYGVGGDVNEEFASDVYRVAYTSMVTPHSVYDVDLTTGERVLKSKFLGYCRW